jgi:hypothetical protein
VVAFAHDGGKVHSLHIEKSAWLSIRRLFQIDTFRSVDDAVVRQPRPDLQIGGGTVRPFIHSFGSNRL